ncbi:hypothetical protein ILP97_27330 [Amycolatopsis sp. H6(2020)]|nr:hypothetical protein [Amycolatopsis sp. H6(2020)]
MIGAAAQLSPATSPGPSAASAPSSRTSASGVGDGRTVPGRITLSRAECPAKVATTSTSEPDDTPTTTSDRDSLASRTAGRPTAARIQAWVRPRPSHSRPNIGPTP